MSASRLSGVVADSSRSKSCIQQPFFEEFLDVVNGRFIEACCEGICFPKKIDLSNFLVAPIVINSCQCPSFHKLLRRSNTTLTYANLIIFGLADYHWGNILVNTRLENMMFY